MHLPTTGRSSGWSSAPGTVLGTCWFIPTSRGRRGSRVVPAICARRFANCTEASVGIETAVTGVCGWLFAALDGMTHYVDVNA